MARAVAGLLALALLGRAVASATESAPSSSDPLHTNVGKVPAFALTERSGRTVTRDDLLGKVWVVSFFFTSCTAGCSKNTTSMKRLQDDLVGYPDVMLVSITVDPETDTPEVLQRYAASYGADPQRWLFLTGAEKAIYDLIQNGFFQAVTRNSPDAGPGNAVIHTWTLMVVDQKGQIRGYCRDGRDLAEVARVGERVKQLTQTVAWPAVNATLNGCCGILLVLGYLAIRSRWVTTHKVLMLSALAVSAAFLSCYLYYHLVVQRGEPTRFAGEGMARPVYFTILLSHTVLAAGVAPLALITSYLGLRDRLARHVRLARWTLPLWLYVSVTGVIVYWMLYHLYPPV
jgi:protein SCO1/2/putative membrane protein